MIFQVEARICDDLTPDHVLLRRTVSGVDEVVDAVSKHGRDLLECIMQGWPELDRMVKLRLCVADTPYTALRPLHEPDFILSTRMARPIAEEASMVAGQMRKVYLAHLAKEKKRLECDLATIVGLSATDRKHE